MWKKLYIIRDIFLLLLKAFVLWSVQTKQFCINDSLNHHVSTVKDFKQHVSLKNHFCFKNVMMLGNA